ncbi:hypothetical protein HW532_21510 [Kaustia mangrovi]|uniref:Uncharacterized protein n=1 Tax=Kaustia mangrovi TaxID=2593653 RepID=A0A7S8HDV5_9HYPH|nr:hypothetical protein [Kaustia mangrovi]QPC45045.1 hypothetical protein HW532_21510 [Kaustia mangrovi]
MSGAGRVLYAVSPEGPEAPGSGHSRVTFRLRDDVLADISRDARRAGMTRSQYLARIVERARGAER